jgi:hypothetical protein
MGDYKMLGLMIAGKMDGEVERILADSNDQLLLDR